MLRSRKAENLHDKDDQKNPLQQDKTKLEYLQINETDLQSEITNVRSDGDVLISKEIQLS